MCQGDCNDLMKLPAVSTAVTNGADGVNAYVYIASASDSSGSNFTYPAVLDAPGTSNGQFYLSFLSTTTQILNPLVSDFTDWDRVVGTDGSNGTDGIYGGVSFEYTFFTNFSTGDPGNGNIWLNQAPTIANILSISKTDGNAVDINATINSMLSSTSTIKGTVKLTKKTDSSKFVTYAVTANGNFTNHKQLSITYLSSSSSTPFSNAEDIIITFSLTGDKGDTGTTGTAGAVGANGPGYLATSVSSVTIGLGSKTFVTQAGLAYTAGARVRVSDTGSPTANYVEGVCTAYTGTSLTILVDRIAGSGTISTWDINLAGDPGVPLPFIIGTLNPAGGNIAYPAGTIGDALRFISRGTIGTVTNVNTHDVIYCHTTTVGGDATKWFIFTAPRGLMPGTGTDAYIQNVAPGLLSAASGTDSVSFGAQNLSSGARALSSGGGSVASGDDSTAMGDSANATAAAAFSAGRSTVASGVTSVALGKSNTASGVSSVALNEGNTVLAPRATAIGLSNTIASGAQNAFVKNTTNAVSSTALNSDTGGIGSINLQPNSFVRGGGNASSIRGQAQYMSINLVNYALDATPVELVPYAGAGSGLIIMPTGVATTWYCQVRLVGSQEFAGSTLQAIFDVNFGVSSDGSTITYLGNPLFLGDDGVFHSTTFPRFDNTGSGPPTMSLSSSGNSLILSVSGTAVNDLSWSGQLDIQQISDHI